MQETKGNPEELIMSLIPTTPKNTVVSQQAVGAALDRVGFSVQVVTDALKSVRDSGMVNHGWFHKENVGDICCLWHPEMTINLGRPIRMKEAVVLRTVEVADA